MELCNPNVLETLYASSTQPTMAPAKLPRRVMSKRCQCGHCSTCRDNARWERIFREKFADPTYYALRPVRQRSSLYGLE
jgi:hypothetical protein